MSSEREGQWSPAGRNFKLFWLAQGVSATGDAFGMVAMPLLVLEVTGSVAKMGVVTALACAGQIIAGTASGIIVDRVDRRRLMIACDLGRVALYMLLPASIWLHHPSLTLIGAVAFFAGALGNMFTVAQLAAVPNLVEQQDVARANARLQATQALTYVLGALLGGLIAAQFGPGGALAADALSFAGSAVCLALIQLRRDAAVARADTHGASPLADLAIGIRFLLKHAILRSLAVFQIGIAFLGSVGLSAAVIDLFVFRLRSDLGASSQTVGMAIGMASVGAVIGALTSPRLQRRVGVSVCVLGGTAVQAAGLMCAGSTAHVPFIVGGLALWAAGLTLRGVAANSLRQTLTPDALLGRVSAAAWTLVYAAATLGALVVTALAAHAGAARAFVLTGAVLGVITVGAFRSPLGPLRTHAVSTPAR